MDANLLWNRQAKRVGIAGGAALALMFVILAADSIAYYGGPQLLPKGVIYAGWLGLFSAGLGGTAIGFRMMRTSPGSGAVLAVTGSLTAALAWYWLLIPMTIAIGLSIFAVKRARKIINDGA